MCWCTPTNRTPCCGKPACHPAPPLAPVSVQLHEYCPQCVQCEPHECRQKGVIIGRCHRCGKTDARGCDPCEGAPTAGELAAIRARAARGYADVLTCLKDVPALLREVDRLAAVEREYRTLLLETRG